MAVTKNSINTKMTISKKPLVEIDLTLCKNVISTNPFWFFEWNYIKLMQIVYPKWPPGVVTKNSI